MNGHVRMQRTPAIVAVSPGLLAKNGPSAPETAITDNGIIRPLLLLLPIELYLAMVCRHNPDFTFCASRPSNSLNHGVRACGRNADIVCSFLKMVLLMLLLQRLVYHNCISLQYSNHNLEREPSNISRDVIG